ncbi:hypothetical protein FD19_GL000700 [Lacticaseibacillus thailandensis DSM 22698 = JCM 13996]|uniref:Uncharacterized protein n=1 Tax=Lacticaseibacillus thailandensis DSM 22698 = JCM 13996 TaxID=1423810 RepID=A0A0R2CKT3_9LACO|nr:hypothetical protein FD19_GL000700 [Lacticaseibacillus thailandensis DSM 22698 = JCM 13996]
MFTGGSTGRNHAAAKATVFRVQFSFNSWVATRVQDFASINICNDRHVYCLLFLSMTTF